MTFGEHLECLRTHLIKAIFGLVITVVACLFFGDKIVAIVRAPIDAALQDMDDVDVTDDVATDESMWEVLKEKVGSVFGDDSDTDGTESDEPEDEGIPQLATGIPGDKTISVSILPSEFINSVLHPVDPNRYPEIVPQDDEKTVQLRIAAPAFQELADAIERQKQAVTLNVQEAFLTYLKVAFIAGLLVASPWVFFQIWQFVAAGLYPHERKYIYTYLPMSVFLFAGGAVFCFVAVFPFVLKFLLGFNAMLGVQPQIRLSEWISFAVTLPMMFGISFQLPLVMLFLERISVFDVTDYREKRRMAVLVIAFLSMMLTPADPMSMLMMMFPLVILYELGIYLCLFNPSKSAVPDDIQPV